MLHFSAAFAASFAAGAINSIAGGGTLVLFPTLLWLGLDPIVANVTCTSAIWPGSISAAYGFRREIRGHRDWMLLLGIPSLLGGLIGALLLLRTPSRVFASMVPYLIGFATCLLAAQAPIARLMKIEARAAAGGGRGWWLGAAGFQLLVAIYGGYFGAGMGILMLAALGLLGLTDIHQMNGLKNFAAVCINLIAAIYFMLYGPVSWVDLAIIAVGSTAGGFGGAGLARKLGRDFVRRAVVAIGAAMTLWLAFARG